MTEQTTDAPEVTSLRATGCLTPSGIHDFGHGNWRVHCTTCGEADLALSQPLRVGVVSSTATTRELEAEVKQLAEDLAASKSNEDDLRRQLDEALDAADEQADMDPTGEARAEAARLHAIAAHINRHHHLPIGDLDPVEGRILLAGGRLAGLLSWHATLYTPHLTVQKVISGGTLVEAHGGLPDGHTVTVWTCVAGHPFHQHGEPTTVTVTTEQLDQLVEADKCE